MTLVVRNVLCLTAHDAEVSREPVDLTVENGRIAAVTPTGGPDRKSVV